MKWPAALFFSQPVPAAGPLLAWAAERTVPCILSVDVDALQAAPRPERAARGERRGLLLDAQPGTQFPSDGCHRIAARARPLGAAV